MLYFSLDIQRLHTTHGNFNSTGWFFCEKVIATLCVCVLIHLTYQRPEALLKTDSVTAWSKKETPSQRHSFVTSIVLPSEEQFSQIQIFRVISLSNFASNLFFCSYDTRTYFNNLLSFLLTVLFCLLLRKCSLIWITLRAKLCLGDFAAQYHHFFSCLF